MGESLLRPWALLRPRRGEWLLPAASAALLAFSFPPFHLPVLPFVALAPFALWLFDLPGGVDGRRAAVRGSIVFGVLYFGALLYWMLVALVWFTAWAIPAFFGALSLLAAVSVFFGWAFHRAVHVTRVPLWIALPVCWTAAEWLRAHLPGSLAFPWLGLGTSLTGFPEWVGIAELVGARGVTFWLALANGLVAWCVLAIRSRDRQAVLRRVMMLLVVVAVPMAWGIWRARSLETRVAARVAVFQPNIPEHIKLDRSAVFDSTFAALDRLVALVDPGSFDLAILPEVVLPMYPRSADAEQSVERLRAYSGTIGAPLLFGGLGFRQDAVGGLVAPFNSAFLLDADELSGYQYDKRRLVPMVERVPMMRVGWLEALPDFGSFGVGEGWPLAKVAGARYGVLICYESSYPDAARAFRREGADVLVNITNDAWYGRDPLYARTTALWQHPAHLVMRAIENRVGVARAANTGISLLIDPTGRTYEATPLFEAAVRVGEVRTTDITTLYVRLGDWVGLGAMLGTLLLIGVSLRSTGMHASLDRLDDRL